MENKKAVKPKKIRKDNVSKKDPSPVKPDPAKIFNPTFRRIVQNQSTRSSGKIGLLVIHSTESHNRPGSSDVLAVAEWFDNPDSDASSHIIIDAEGISVRCVYDSKKAWTCSKFNSVSLNVELVGFAADPVGVWLGVGKRFGKRFVRLKDVAAAPQLRELAKLLVEWSEVHSIPLRRAVVSDGAVVRSGVTRHMDLGVAGGNHNDPGNNFPFDAVLRYAIYRQDRWRKKTK